MQADCPGDRRNDGCVRHKPASASHAHPQQLCCHTLTIVNSLLFDASNLLETSDDINKQRLPAMRFSFIVTACHGSFVKDGPALAIIDWESQERLLGCPTNSACGIPDNYFISLLTRI